MQRTTRSRSAAAVPLTPLRRGWYWALGLVATSGILAFAALVCLIVAPVSIVTRNLNLTPAVVAVHGSLRAGRAELLGGYQLDWQSHARMSLLPYLATDFTLSGEDTRLVGEVETGAHGILLDALSGRAGPGLAQWVPGAWTCTMTARVAEVSFLWGWRRAAASGMITTPEGTCTKNAQTITLPPLELALTADGTDAVVALSATQDEPLASVRIRRERRLDIVVLPAAADVFPQLPRGGPINMQLPF